ncbi:DUF5655 domain-containing protein [Bacteroidota bacterium]
MPWTCPECKRSFKNKNQDHSCVVIKIDAHFIDKSTTSKYLYDHLIKQVRDFGEVKVSAVVNAIICSTKSTFLVIKPKKNWIDIEFLLDEMIEEFPVYKTGKASSKRFAHFVRIENVNEIDEQLLGWLKRSYRLISELK